MPKNSESDFKAGVFRSILEPKNHLQAGNGTGGKAVNLVVCE